MVTTFKYTDFKVYEQVILDYLREGFPWPARPCKHTESNLFKHAVTTFKYTNLYFIPPGPRGLARPSTYLNVVTVDSILLYVFLSFQIVKKIGSQISLHLKIH